MKIASVAEVKAKFSAFVKESEGGPIIVTKNGKPVAVLLSVQDEDEIERLLMAYSPQLQAILEQSRKQIHDGEGIDHASFWSESSPTTKPIKAEPKKRVARPKK